MAPLLLALLSLAAPPGAPAFPSAATPPAENLIVLRNGEILVGRATPAGDRLLVTVPAGQIRLPASDVEFVCGSLDEAYRRKLAALHSDSPEDHVALAGWCLRHRLTPAAAQELTAVLRLDPRHPRLPWLEHQLKLQLGEAPGRATVSAALPLPAVPDDPERLLKELPPAAVESFTASIGPLLANRCQTSGCHGPASADALRLLPPHPERAANRRLTLRNLATVLAQVDRAEPERSPLLARALAAHGTARMPPLAESSPAYRTLLAWVRQLELAAPQHPASPGAAPLPVGVPAANSTAPPSSSEPSAPTPPPGPLEKPVAPAEPNPAPTDPFDPEIFNRRYRPTAPAQEGSTP